MHRGRIKRLVPTVAVERGWKLDLTLEVAIVGPGGLHSTHPDLLYVGKHR